MGFWSSGSSDSTSSSDSSSTDFTAPEETSFGGTNFASPSSPSGSSFTGGAGAGPGAELQQFSMALQQQILVQQVVTNLTDQAFERCITKPGDSLSGKEAACIHATVGKWLDTSEFMMGRLAKKQQRQGSFS